MHGLIIHGSRSIRCRVKFFFAFDGGFVRGTDDFDADFHFRLVVAIVGLDVHVVILTAEAFQALLEEHLTGLRVDSEVSGRILKQRRS